MLPEEEYRKRMEELDKQAVDRRQVRRKRTFIVVFVILFAIVLAVLAAWYTYYKQIYWDAPRRPKTEGSLVFQELERLTTVLVLGGDILDKEEGRTDTIFVLGYLPNSNFVSVLTIPRDTLVEVDGAMSRINEANGKGGPGLAMDCVETLLGVEIDYYVLLNFQAFEKIIDTLGGVELVVEKDMQYDDFAGNLHIDITAGLQVLDGRTALGYIRYRGDGLGDITAADPVKDVYKGRVVRQQNFISALQKQVLRPATILRLPALLSDVSQGVKTNLPIRKAISIAKRFHRTEDLHYGVIPGSEQRIRGASYWIADQDVLAYEVIEVFSGITRPVIGVLNGSGKRGIAAEVASCLRQNGYRIQEIGNADHYDYETTQIKYQESQNRDFAEQVRSLMGETAEIMEEVDQAVDLLVIVGKDYVSSN
ncbi:MAG: LCP family protein [Limnochordia bacterium]|jgi:LCP family protein required for cell wall assembly|nr:LCP family protein [Limnochordia bacterium]